MKKSFVKSAGSRHHPAHNPTHQQIHLALDWLSTHPANSLELTQSLLAADPENPLLWVIATKAHQRLGQFFQADECIGKALAFAPNFVEAIYAKSDLLYRSDRFEEAEIFLAKAVKTISPDEGRPLRSLYATVLQKMKKYREAREIYQALAEEVPDNWLYWNNLGMVEQDLSRFAEMDAAYAKSCEVVKENPTPFFNQIVGAHYDPTKSAEQILTLCKVWQQKFKPNKVTRAVAKDLRADKRIRVGLISDGLRSHPVGQMITLGLGNIPESQLEFYAYSTNYKEDHLTHRIKRMCAKWQVIEHISPAELDKLIRADEIDILFDLSGYNANSRSQTMQMAPAPVQIKWVGGLISSTGLETMDYLLSDNVETPPGYDALYTEKLIRMPDDYVCYDPPFYLPPVSGNPVSQNGYFTFGCFNNASKINEPLLAEWAVLLQQVPDSRLFLKSFNFDDEALKEKVVATLTSHGIEPYRVRIEGSSAHQELLASYNDVDIALDPWPYSGGLTTCEAMAMGVPVVTLPGPTFAGRHSASHLVNAGLQELVATDWQNYIDIAVGLTHDLNSLTIIRENLRSILLASPVCDGQRFGKNFADAMRAVWQRYCEGKAPEAVTLSNDAPPHFHDEHEPMVLLMPVDETIAEEKPQSEAFEFHLAGQMVMMDFGGGFITGKKFMALSELNAFFFIVMDTVGVVKEGHLPLRRKYLQHIKLHAPGDGEQAAVYVCLDENLSSTLRPLTDVMPGAQIITEIKTQTSKLDAIQGLDRLELLVLDNKYDLKPVFEHGVRVISECLVLEVRVSLTETHHGQMGLSDICRLLGNYGFTFHAFSEIEYGEPVVSESNSPLSSSRMRAARALFLPDAHRMSALSNEQREKLAFIVHAVYDMKDAAYHVFAAGSPSRAEDYLGGLNGKNSTSSSGITPTAKSIIPQMPRMSCSEVTLFEEYLKKSRAYFEYGSGGSTKLAVRHNVEVYGVESDKFWVETLHKETGPLCKVEYVNIGPTKEWGYPVDDSHREKFTHYSEAILKYDNAFDFILVDGRFRVACTLNAIKHTLKKQGNIAETLIFIHDFWDRPDYHDVLEFLDIAQVAESAGLFRLKANINPTSLENMLAKYKYVAV